MKKRITTLLLMLALAFSVGAVLLTNTAEANHPVLVEGNCPGPAARTKVLPGTCGDFDGDGNIGTAEDVDGPDRIFGTINAALGAGAGPAAGTGANQNGRVIIVASGNYPEIVSITGANGNVLLEAAPGVEANIEAVLQGDTTPPGNGGRQDAPGIIVNAPGDRFVVIRNITSRNWTSGIQVLGDSRVDIEGVRLDSNTNFGVEVRDNAQVTIAKSEISGTGRRAGGPTPASNPNNFPTQANPMPGNGIDFSGNSRGTVFLTTVSHSFRAGIANRTGKRDNVCASKVNVFGNNPNFQNVRVTSKPCNVDDDGDSDSR